MFNAPKTLFGVLAAYRLLDALYQGDMKAAEAAARTLGEWCADNPGMDGSEVYLALRTQLENVLNVPGPSMREYNTLREPLTNVLSEWLDKIHLKLYYSLAPKKNCAREAAS